MIQTSDQKCKLNYVINSIQAGGGADRGQRTASSHLHTDTSRPLSFFWKQLGSLSSSPSAILASLSRTSSYSSGSSFSQYLLIWSPIPREDT